MINKYLVFGYRDPRLHGETTYEFMLVASEIIVNSNTHFFGFKIIPDEDVFSDGKIIRNRPVFTCTNVVLIRSAKEAWKIFNTAEALSEHMSTLKLWTRKK